MRIRLSKALGISIVHYLFLVYCSLPTPQLFANLVSSYTHNVIHCNGLYKM